ncbi:MAG: hypothetical protein K2I01_09055, partial [Lachnospiraceae bacterium]|nr:hypothetical protein [Lachnospiraceae bacterium]
MKKKLFKRITTAVLAGVLAFSMAACGDSGKGDGQNGGTNGGSNGGNGSQTQGGQDGYVWVPKYYEMPKSEENVWYGSFSFVGSSLYY